jgi:hypothetical protein
MVFGIIFLAMVREINESSWIGSIIATPNTIEGKIATTRGIQTYLFIYYSLGDG